jgi:hypothetical protein
MKRQYFGTDGVRGEYGGPLINPAFAWRLGVAAGRCLTQMGDTRPLVLIGRDTRHSGPVLENALAAGLQKTGASVKSLGVVPTPAVSHAVRLFAQRSASSSRRRTIRRRTTASNFFPPRAQNSTTPTRRRSRVSFRATMKPPRVRSMQRDR